MRIHGVRCQCLPRPGRMGSDEARLFPGSMLNVYTTSLIRAGLFFIHGPCKKSFAGWMEKMR